MSPELMRYSDTTSIVSAFLLFDSEDSTHVARAVIGIGDAAVIRSERGERRLLSGSVKCLSEVAMRRDGGQETEISAMVPGVVGVEGAHQ